MKVNKFSLNLKSQLFVMTSVDGMKQKLGTWSSQITEDTFKRHVQTSN